MFKNVYYDTKNSLIYLWEQVNGVNSNRRINWVPYIYSSTPNGTFQTIEGLPAEKKTFNTYSEYYGFCKNNSVNVYENSVRPEIQFLAEHYHTIPDEDIIPPNLLIYYIDIEVNYGNRVDKNGKRSGFPNAKEALDPVCLISVRDSQTGNTVVFGEKEYTGNIDEDITYLHCPDEQDCSVGSLPI